MNTSNRIQESITRLRELRGLSPIDEGKGFLYGSNDSSQYQYLADELNKKLPGIEVVADGSRKFGLYRIELDGEVVGTLSHNADNYDYQIDVKSSKIKSQLKKAITDTL